MRGAVMILLLSTLLLASAEARLGDSVFWCASKHGGGKSGRNVSGSYTGVLGFRDKTYEVFCYFVDGKCTSISYKPHKEWTEKMIQSVLYENRNGAKWTEDEAAGEKRSWTRSDGGRAVLKEVFSLAVQGQGFVSPPLPEVKLEGSDDFGWVVSEKLPDHIHVYNEEGECLYCRNWFEAQWLMIQRSKMKRQGEPSK